MPKRLIEDGLLEALTPSAHNLHTFLLYKAQELSSPILRIRTSEIIEQTGVSKNSLKDARAVLARHKLVRSAEQKSGLWLYEIVTKTNAKGLDFDSLTRDELEAFFIDRLGDACRRNDNGLRFKCPFHNCKKHDYPLTVKLEQADELGLGVWQCFDCFRAGKLVELEYKLAIRRKEHIYIGEAHERVGRFFANLRDARESEREVAEARKLLFG